MVYILFPKLFLSLQSQTIKTIKVMYEIKGKYTDDVKVFAENVEESALAQVQEIADCPANKGKKVRIMPDCHTGVNICIGASVPVDVDNPDERICPGHVGVDIGCTVSMTLYDKPVPEENIPILEHRLKKLLPFGMNINEGVSYDKKELKQWLNKYMDRLVSAHPIFADYAVRFNDDRDISDWLGKIGMNDKLFYKSLPSIGGGNHFVEYSVDEKTGHYGMLAHCGSRNLGKKVYEYWAEIASGKKFPKEVRKAIVEEVKRNNTDRRKLDAEIQAAKDKWMEGKIPGYLGGEDMLRYLVDVCIAQAYASYNHELIHRVMAKVYGELSEGKPIEYIRTTHNYIDYDFEALDGVPHMMVRKGAIRSYSGEKMIIPFNMRDGISVCVGKSNPDWNFTAPHGAGRLMSRKVAFDTLDVDEFKKQMSDAGIYTTTADKNTLDEAPGAYKPKEDIVRLIEPTADILYFMKPKMNIKSAENFGGWRKKKEDKGDPR